MNMKTLKKSPVALPLAWEDKLLERTLHLKVSRAEYIRELVRRDLNIEGMHTARQPQGLGGLSYPIEFDVPSHVEKSLKAIARSKEVTLSTVVLAIMQKNIEGLADLPFKAKKYNKDLWVRDQAGAYSEVCRIKVAVPNAWREVVDAYANGKKHATAVRDLVSAVIGAAS